MKSKIPELTTDDDAERFVDTADLARYDLTGFKRVQFGFQARTAQLNMRLPQMLLDAVKERAKARGVSYTKFVQDTLEVAVAGQSHGKNFTSGTQPSEDLQLMSESRSVLVGGRPLHLMNKEYMLLELLFARKNMVITQEVMINHLYGGVDEPESRTVHAIVSKLRKKLAAAGAVNVIGTVWGRGYMVREVISEQNKKKYIMSVA